jgi:hypothetical protein
MKLLLRRDQKKSLTGKIVFTVDARAELTPEEREAVQKYKMGDTLLYEKMKLLDRGSGLLGFFSRLAFRATNIKVTVNDLVHGKHLECKDILEMRGVEEQIKEASETFKAVLDTAAHFGGEEVIEY